MIDKDKKVNKLVEESGMITHFKTANILKNKDWSVLISPYYHDEISDSIRETDLVAEKPFNSDTHRPGSSVQLNIQIFIECKYINREVVFWFDEIDKEKAITSIEKETSLKIAHRSHGDTTIQNFHYFNESFVAKLFSTNSNKEDVIYKAMNQCLHSQINYRIQGKKPIFSKFIQDDGVYSNVVQYPVIVCDNFDNLLKVKFQDSGEFTTEKLKDHFILETNYRDDYFLIDIVDINYLGRFLKDLEVEAVSLVNSYSMKSIK